MTVWVLGREIRDDVKLRRLTILGFVGAFDSAATAAAAVVAAAGF